MNHQINACPDCGSMSLLHRPHCKIHLTPVPIKSTNTERFTVNISNTVLSYVGNDLNCKVCNKAIVPEDQVVVDSTGFSGDVIHKRCNSQNTTKHNIDK